LITLLGAVIGVAVGLLLCWVQIEYGLIRFGGAEGSFIIDAYPVSVQWTDVVLVFVTVIIVGFLTAWLPVSYLTRKVIGQRDSE
jgi:lipoprotein-releasing system permease protein